MTPGDVARILAKASAFDSRTIGEADIHAWHEIIGNLDYGDCLGAVTAHYREQNTRVMPADVRRLAAGIRDVRQAHERQAERRQAIESGSTVRDRSADVTALVRTVAAALPAGRPDQLRYRDPELRPVTAQELAIARARRERGGRPAAKAPKQKKRPKRPGDYPPPQTDDIAAMAGAYLVAGYSPEQVAERLGVSRRWCADRFRAKGESA